MVETPQEAAIVGRCQATIVRALTGPCEDAKIAELVADLSRLPADHSERGRLAAGMLMALFRSGSGAIESARHSADLLRIADTDPPADPQWIKVRSLARVHAFAYAGMNGQLIDLPAVEAELTALTEAVGDHPAAQAFIDSSRMAAAFVRAIEEGNESALQRMPAELAALTDRLRDHPELAPLVRSLDPAVQAMAAIQRRDHVETWKHVERFQEVAQDLSGGDFLRTAMVNAFTQLKPLQQMFVEPDAVGGAPPTDDELAKLKELANRPDATDYDCALAHLALGNAFMRGGRETDLSRIETGIEHFRQALSLTSPGHSQHAFFLQSVVLGLYRHSEVTGTTDGLDEAARMLEQVCDLLGGPHHPQWGFANEMLAMIRHRSGDIRKSGELGLTAQRGYVWRALLESDAGGAKIAIRDAAQNAVDLVRRCLLAGNPVDALRALDSGRGLMLFAATELRKIPDRLDAAGRSDLARRWEAAGGDLGDLRREVLAVLTTLPDIAGNLLDPPSLDEIQSALAALDADALVYLVAAEPPHPGLAVIAPVDGPVAWMALPNLTVSDDTDVEGYLAALVDRSRDLAAPLDDGQFAGRLAVLCDWAWRAAIGPLLERYFEDWTLRSGGPVPRIVLIPMGDLARIPWQAARRDDGVYAVQLAAFSQAVSARLLCENAASPPVALSSSGLVVGDPDTGGAACTLDAARLEAHAIRQAFYQGARYVGRRPNGTVSPSGRGTADEVRRWLADPGPAAGVMLHLACHGSFATGLDDAKSFLWLAPAEPGGSGELTAAEILDLLAAAAQRQVGLVVLAACNTGRSVHGYDEAYSLGTAFLAGSARSVLSTQWSIPDAQTPSLMYLFHHYCRTEGLPPWQALRQAQMWMLDPHRRAPERMPAELLQSVPAGEPAPVVAWAGFIHYGQ